MMTRKDYVKVSELVSKALKSRLGKQFTLELLALELSEYFQSDNPNFDEAKFLKACGLDWLVEK